MAAGFRSIRSGALHEFVGWLQRRVPLDHFPSANITIDAAAVSYGQVGIGHDVLRTAVSTEKVSAMDDCSSAHRGIVCTLAETLDRVLAGGSSSRQFARRRAARRSVEA
jgi:hypothetical protein